MKKVAFFNHTSDVSGAEISLLLTARHLKRVTPLIFAPEGELLERARASGIGTVTTESRSARLSRNPIRLAAGLFSLLRGGWAFAGYVVKHDADLIHANSLRAGIMASLFAWKHRRPVVWHVRDLAPGGLVGAVIARLARMACRAVIGISDSVIARFPNRLLGDRLHVVHNGVELKPLSAKEKAHNRKKLRFEFGTPDNRRVISIIGQITPWKRQEDAITAAHHLIRSGHDIELWIVGEAKFREENIRYMETLKQLTADLGIENRVIFTGFRQDVLEICCAADVLFLCSDQEPFGRVIIEAMSQQTAVVATNAGGVPEIITEECGLLYPVGDVKKLTEAAESLLRDERQRTAIGEQGSLRVQSHFTIERTAAKVEEIYERILGVRLPLQPAISEGATSASVPKALGKE